VILKETTVSDQKIAERFVDLRKKGHFSSAVFSLLCFVDFKVPLMIIPRKQSTPLKGIFVLKNKRILESRWKFLTRLKNKQINSGGKGEKEENHTHVEEINLSKHMKTVGIFLIVLCARGQ